MTKELFPILGRENTTYINWKKTDWFQVTGWTFIQIRKKASEIKIAWLKMCLKTKPTRRFWTLALFKYWAHLFLCFHDPMSQKETDFPLLNAFPCGYLASRHTPPHLPFPSKKCEIKKRTCMSCPHPFLFLLGWPILVYTSKLSNITQDQAPR